MNLKYLLKHVLLSRLHGVETWRFNLADNLASVGVRNYAELEYGKLKADVLGYLNVLEQNRYEYLFARSRPKPVLYGSVYAVMLRGLFGDLKNESASEKSGWSEYLNSFQKEDGFYYDPGLEGDAFEHKGIWHEGWGKKHLLGHMIIALARLDTAPKYEFSFLRQYYDKDFLLNWMDGFALDADVWTDSNYFMNLYTALQYSRDWMNDTRAGAAIEVMAEWLLGCQSPESGMWHRRKIEDMSVADRLSAVRGAYHFYPLFEYDKIEVPHRERVIDFILPLQNRWGAFAQEESCSGACEEIDALEPLIRFANETGYRTVDVKAVVMRSLIWCLSARCQDGGFSFYPCAGQAYGGHPLTTNLTGESSLFATWFRTLTLAYQLRYLGIPNSFEIGRYPGYEIT